MVTNVHPTINDFTTIKILELIKKYPDIIPNYIDFKIKNPDEL